MYIEKQVYGTIAERKRQRDSAFAMNGCCDVSCYCVHSKWFHFQLQQSAHMKKKRVSICIYACIHILSCPFYFTACQVIKKVWNLIARIGGLQCVEISGGEKKKKWEMKNKKKKYEDERQTHTREKIHIHTHDDDAYTCYSHTRALPMYACNESDCDSSKRKQWTLNL